METPDTLPNFQLEWRPGCGDPASTMKWKSSKINIFFLQKITKIPTFAKFKRDFGREGPSRWKGMTSPLFGHLRTKKKSKKSSSSSLSHDEKKKTQKNSKISIIFQKNKSYFCDFQIKISPRPDRLMTEGYHHSNGNPLAVLCWSEKFPARRLPRQKSHPQNRRYSQFSVDFHNIFGAGKFKNPIWPPGGTRASNFKKKRMVGAWLWPSPRPGSSLPPLLSFFFCHNSPSVPSRLSRLVPDPYRYSMGGRVPTIWVAATSPWRYRSWPISITRTRSSSAKPFRAKITVFSQICPEFCPLSRGFRWKSVRHRAIFSSENGGFG